MMLSRWCKQTVLGTVVSLLAVPGTGLACESWNLGNMFTVSQANGARVIVHHINQSGDRLEASAKYSGGRGDLSGSLSSDGRFKFTIDWDNGSVGVYTAHIDEDGEVLDGRTYDRTSPSSWSIWKMHPVMCSD